MREALARIVGGRADTALLGNCRLEWAGVEAYGEEAIRELFASSPVTFDDGTFAQTATAAAWMGSDTALFADLYDGHVGRLWRLGPGPAPDPEPSLAVAFDPDLRQDRQCVYLRLADHPQLDPEATPAIIAAGEALIAQPGEEPLHRVRAFAMRAFSLEKISVALFSLHRLTGGPVRSSAFGYAMAWVGAMAPQIVVDQRPKLPWTPRL